MVKSPQIDQTTIERLTEPVAARTCKSIGMMPKMMPVVTVKMVVVTMTMKIMLVVIMTMKIMLVVIMPKKIMIFLSSLKLFIKFETHSSWRHKYSAADDAADDHLN